MLFDSFCVEFSQYHQCIVTGENIAQKKLIFFHKRIFGALSGKTVAYYELILVHTKKKKKEKETSGLLSPASLIISSWGKIHRLRKQVNKQIKIKELKALRKS